jgi:Leucine Rich repeat
MKKYTMVDDFRRKLNDLSSVKSLTCTHVGDRGASVIADVLKVKNNTLWITLDLTGNKIADALKVNSTLTSLHLNDNQIQSFGAIVIADALEVNSTLTLLHLNGNNIGVRVESEFNTNIPSSE